jgi:hypothetical protein
MGRLKGHVGIRYGQRRQVIQEILATAARQPMCIIYECDYRTEWWTRLSYSFMVTFGGGVEHFGLCDRHHALLRGPMMGQVRLRSGRDEHSRMLDPDGAKHCRLGKGKWFGRHWANLRLSDAKKEVGL